MAQSDGARTQQDIVGDRSRVIEIGFTAVGFASVLFGVFRLAAELVSGKATPWWANVGGSGVIVLLYLWYRGDRDRRSSPAVHGLAAIATVMLLIPAAYGMTSSKWWLSLVGYAVLLMGRRREAQTWTVITLVLLPLAALLEPYVMMANARGEPLEERVMAAFFFVAILLAITWAFRRVARRRAVELTETAASLERANRVKSRFLAHMSHEIRTPLHAVIAMTDLALEGEAAPAVHEQVETARESARLLLSLLNNVLDVARAESDAVELDARPFAVHQALGDALRPLAAQARARGLDFVARADPGVPSERVGDRVRVSQVALNLVGNAIKFTKVGRVEVRLRVTEADPDRILLEVADTGAGIPRERQAAIFEPFTQADAADAGNMHGAGLGLAIVKDLVLRMQGTVRVDSEPGRGAKFYVELRLPRAPGADAPGPVDLLAPSSPRGSRAPKDEPRALRVLLCEDNAVNQKVVLAMLDRLGHQVTVASDGERAWELLQRHEYDLLLTDVEMPGIDGLELTRRVRARESQPGGRRRIPIVGATAHVGEDEQHRLLGAGMDAHLAKPFTLSDLTSALGRLRP